MTFGHQFGPDLEERYQHAGDDEDERMNQLQVKIIYHSGKRNGCTYNALKIKIVSSVLLLMYLDRYVGTQQNCQVLFGLEHTPNCVVHSFMKEH